MSQNYQPVIIIGAARSGTNLLRDLLTSLPAIETWPCDEINHIWRHGNARCNHDEFTEEMATPGVCRYIRKQFDKMHRRTDAAFLVEKTCANSLRVEFVHKVVPNAKYLFLVRDGRDAMLSADARWKAGLNPGYLMAKARFVPKTDLPFYAVRYAGNRLHRLFSSDKRLSTWGPRFRGMDAFTRRFGLDATCAKQWASSVERAAEAFENMSTLGDDVVLPVQYESLVQNPAVELRTVCNFLGFEIDDVAIASVTHDVFGSSAGRWRRQLDPARLEAVAPILDPVLTQFGYESSEQFLNNLDRHENIAA